MTTDYLVVGAGLFGATCARVLADAGKSVQVIERRDHIAGNCFDENYGGCYVNRYGGHIFHTNSRRIWDFLGRFTEWRQYEHRVKAWHDGKLYSFPPNLMTFEQMGLHPGPVAEQAIRDTFFVGYTAKQWGKPIAEVPPSVIKRIPIRYNYDDRYFGDRYQGMPEQGYTRMVGRMLDGIPVELGADFVSDVDYWRRKAGKVIYSGRLDELFQHSRGSLEYRSLEHQTETYGTDDYQGCATVNFSDASIRFTRIMEWKHFGWRGVPKGETVITTEYPQAWEGGRNEPFYPVEDDANLARQAAYASDAAALKWLRYGGRLGSHKYWNMDQVVAQAIAVAIQTARADDNGGRAAMHEEHSLPPYWHYERISP